MSSNAFARSRPRVRHQRVSKTHCDHPRFLQLVNELARINEAKKKQEEAEGSGGGVSECSEDDGGGGSGPGGSGGGGTCQGSTNLSGGSSCCATIIGGAQASNGYRSLDSNQSTSALHDNYHQHPQHNQTNSSSTTSHHHHQHYHHHHHQHTQHHHHNQHPHQDLQHISNTINLHQHDDRCPSKSSSSSFGYSKQNLVEQTNISDFSNNSSDLRQDENRSKRKRSATDPLAIYSRKSVSSCGGNSTSKRYKSSSDAIRPLSPSFTKCPICLLDSMDRDPSFTNTCFHLFCYVCIENWTKNKATCPLCRTKFTKIIYKIKSATNYEEKLANPIRRDDDEGYINDRLMLEHLSGINPNSTVSSRNNHNDDVQFLFENLRNPEALLAPQHFDSRSGESLYPFNAVTPTTNFNSTVPHSPFTPTSYSIAPNSFILFQQPNRIVPNTTSTAITSAYNETLINNSLVNISTRRVSRSGRTVYPPRNYEPPNLDNSSRGTRASNVSVNQPSVPLERHHIHQHQHQNPHPHHHQHNQHRSTLDMSTRQNQRIEQLPIPHQLPYQIQQSRYNQNPYIRRPYINPPVEHQHLLDLYRQMPDNM